MVQFLAEGSGRCILFGVLMQEQTVHIQMAPATRIASGDSVQKGVWRLGHWVLDVETQTRQISFCSADAATASCECEDDGTQVNAELFGPFPWTRNIVDSVTWVHHLADSQQPIVSPTCAIEVIGVRRHQVTNRNGHVLREKAVPEWLGQTQELGKLPGMLFSLTVGWLKFFAPVTQEQPHADTCRQPPEIGPHWLQFFWQIVTH